MFPHPRRIVVVSGAPGAGKTTLAVPLAIELGFPLFCKDFIKETLTDALGGAGGDLIESRRIGGAAMALLWSLAERTPYAVLEANFRPHSDYERSKLLGLNADVLEIHCDCGAEESARRFRERAATRGHHAAHPLQEFSQNMLADYDGPVGVGAVLQVDTRLPVDIRVLAASVRRGLKMPIEE